MKLPQRAFWWIAATLCLAVPSQAQTGSVATPFDGFYDFFNTFAGTTFDLCNVGADPLVVTDFDVNLLDIPAPDVGDEHSFAVYWTPNTAVGVEQTPGAWTLLDSVSGVVSNGDDVPTPLGIGGLSINPGACFGIYIDMETFQFGDLMLDTASTPTTYSDGTLELTTNTGHSTPPFSNLIPDRRWNGVVHYAVVSGPLGVPVLGPLGMLLLIVGLAGVGVAFLVQRAS